MRSFISSILFAATAFGLTLAPIERASAQAAMTLDCFTNECSVANAPAGTAALWWSLNGPGGPTANCGDNDSVCDFACTRVAPMRVSVTAVDSNGQAIATASKTAGCAPTDW